MSADDRNDIVVIGAGSWGTALAIQFARSGHRTLLWGLPEDHLDRLASGTAEPGP